MPRLEATKTEVYLFRRRRGRIQFLALRRSPGRSLPGVWQPVTGGLERGELPLAGAAREVLEETGLEPRRWWHLETLTVFYEPADDAIMVLPLFAAEVDARAVVRLSHEHDAHAFVSASNAARRFLWESQRRALQAVRREVLRGGSLARALEVTSLLKTARVGRRRPASTRSASGRGRRT